MYLFLTSSPCDTDGKLFEKNRLADDLRMALNGAKNGLYIASDPHDREFTERYSEATQIMLQEAGICFDEWMILDERTAQDAPDIVPYADFICLTGGHVPTQNQFFCEIALKNLIDGFNGTIMGVSAGTMNSAQVVYAQPELDGEGTNPDFELFLDGLGLTQAMVLPHYRFGQDRPLDGRMLYADITASHSFGNCFFALPDGSYIYGDGSIQEIRGKAWTISDGVLNQICEDEETFLFSD